VITLTSLLYEITRVVHHLPKPEELPEPEALHPKTTRSKHCFGRTRVVDA